MNYYNEKGSVSYGQRQNYINQDLAAAIAGIPPQKDWDLLSRIAKLQESIDELRGLLKPENSIILTGPSAIEAYKKLGLNP